MQNRGVVPEPVACTANPAHGLVCRFQRLKSEVEFGPVVGRKKHITNGRGAHPTLEQLPQPEHVAERLGHLAGVEQQVLSVQPVAGE